MSVRDRILANIAALPDDRLAELAEYIPAPEEDATPELGLMERLRKYTFEGPEDFSENVDLYLSGEKRE